MKHLAAGLVICVAAAALSGCYVDPGYSYVRQTPYQGDVYYGQGTRVYDDGYYAAPVYPAYGYPAYGYPAYGYGCCYAPGVSVGISGTWYGGSRYRDSWRGRRGDYRGSWRDRGSHRDGHRRSDRDGRPDG